MKLMENRPPRVVTTHVDSPHQPLPQRNPGDSNEIPVLIGRMPVAHTFAATRPGLLGRLDTGVDWFWFLFAAFIFIGVPLVGVLAMIFN